MSNRIDIIGIDKQNTSSIRSGANVLTLLRAQARQHEQNRLDSIAETMAIVAILIRQGVLTGNEAVSIRGAVYQFDQGTKANHTHAAHCLPGHLTFNTQSLHDLGQWNAPRLRERGLKPIPTDAKLRNLGGRTDVADARINHADSLLERLSATRGLAYLFSRAVGEMVRRPTLKQNFGWQPVRDTVLFGVNHYRNSASLICQQRLSDLAPKLLVGTPAEKAKAQEMEAVISEYLQIVRQGPDPECLGLREFDVLVRDIVVA